MTPIRNRISEGMTRERLALEIRRAARPFAIWVSLIVVGLTATGFVLGKLNLPWPWEHQYRVRIAVDGAKGVVPRSNDVRIAGVPVGNVASVDLVGGRPVITAEIDPAHGPLYRDARLRLRPSTSLQDMYLDVVSRGTPSAGRVPDGGLIAAGRTQTPVDLGKVLNVFDADVRPRVTATIDTLGRGLADRGARLRQALVELAPFLRSARRLGRAIATREGHTRRLIHNFQLMSGELARRDRQVTRLVRGGAGTFGQLAAVNDSLAALLEELPPTLRTLPGSFATLRAAADELDPTARALLPVARALPSGLESLARLSPDARTALAALDRPLPGLTALLHATRPVAADLGDAFGTLRPQAPRLDRITAAVVPCERMVQKFLAWTMSIAKLADVHGVVPRGQQVYGSASAGVPQRGLKATPGCAEGGPRK